MAISVPAVVLLLLLRLALCLPSVTKPNPKFATTVSVLASYPLFTATSTAIYSALATTSTSHLVITPTARCGKSQKQREVSPGVCGYWLDILEYEGTTKTSTISCASDAVCVQATRLVPQMIYCSTRDAKSPPTTMAIDYDNIPQEGCQPGQLCCTESTKPYWGKYIFPSNATHYACSNYRFEIIATTITSTPSNSHLDCFSPPKLYAGNYSQPQSGITYQPYPSQTGQATWQSHEPSTLPPPYATAQPGTGSGDPDPPSPSSSESSLLAKILSPIISSIVLGIIGMLFRHAIAELFRQCCGPCCGRTTSNGTSGSSYHSSGNENHGLDVMHRRHANGEEGWATVQRHDGRSRVQRATLEQYDFWPPSRQ